MPAQVIPFPRPARADVTQVIRPLEPELATRWTVDTADMAVAQHERGDFRASAQLWEAMRKDDRIDAVMTTRVQALLGCDFSLEPSPRGDQGKAKAFATEVQDSWEVWANEDVLTDALNWRIGLGFAVGELIWYDQAGKLRDAPQWLRIHHPQYIRWDATRSVLVMSTHDGDVDIVNGNGKWVVFGGRSERPWMRGAVRSLWILWLGRQYGYRDLQVFGERTGRGILGVQTPSSVGEPERRAYINHLKRVWRGVVAELPQQWREEDGAKMGYGLEIFETKATERVFEIVRNVSDVSIAVRMLGQNLTTEVQGGSYAATKAHERVRVDYLRADSQGLSTDIRLGALEYWANLRHSDPNVAPRPKFDVEPAADPKAIAEAQKASGEAVNAWKLAGYEVTNAEEIAERQGLEIKKAPEPPPPVMAPAGPALRPGAGGAPPPPARRVAASETAQDDQPEPGFLNGQAYIDSLVERSTQRASEALAIDVANILRVIGASSSRAELKAGLQVLYASATPTELAQVLQRAELMADMAGKYSAIEDALSG